MTTRVADPTARSARKSPIADRSWNVASDWSVGAETETVRAALTNGADRFSQPIRLRIPPLALGHAAEQVRTFDDFVLVEVQATWNGPLSETLGNPNQLLRLSVESETGEIEEREIHVRPEVAARLWIELPLLDQCDPTETCEPMFRFTVEHLGADPEGELTIEATVHAEISGFGDRPDDGLLVEMPDALEL